MIREGTATSSEYNWCSSSQHFILKSSLSQYSPDSISKQLNIDKLFNFIIGKKQKKIVTIDPIIFSFKWF